VLKESTDPVVRSASFDSSTGAFTVPARTTAVFKGKTPPGTPSPVIGGSSSSNCGVTGTGSAAMSALALVLGFMLLRRSRRREQ
jgi:pullulanase